jgi:hypothetical protein
MGVLPYRVRTSTNYRTGQDEHVEEAKVHALEVVVRRDVEPGYSIDWLENLPKSLFIWPDFVETKTETVTRRKFGIVNDGITLLSTDSGQSSSRTAAKIVVAGTEIYVCALRRRDKDKLVKDELVNVGCIIYVGNPDDEFRKKVRNANSFALGVCLVDLGRAVYSTDWEIISFKSHNAYNVNRKVLDLVVPPTRANGCSLAA